ncbi:hypothetical protein [Microbacterium sp. LBN7]|uniref:hypothetical protein n=1 Tax=Microbacterium sp. LBN7 TaxID=3129773 RepID=UPI00324A9860
MRISAAAEMTEVSTRVLAGNGSGVYDAMMDGTGRLLDLIERDHSDQAHVLWSAYVLWSEICDRWETSDGPDAVATVAAAARETSIAWLAIDSTTEREVDAFFRERFPAGGA